MTQFSNVHLGKAWKVGFRCCSRVRSILTKESRGDHQSWPWKVPFGPWPQGRRTSWPPAKGVRSNSMHMVQHWPQAQEVSAIFETWQSFVVCNDHVDEWIDKFYQIFIKVLQALLCQLHLGAACSQLDHPTLRSRSCRGCWRYKAFFYHNCCSFSIIDTWSRWIATPTSTVDGDSD